MRFGLDARDLCMLKACYASSTKVDMKIAVSHEALNAFVCSTMYVGMFEGNRREV